MTNGDGILARLVSWHTYPGTKAPWWGIPALLFYDALGFLSVGWVVFDLQKADAGLAVHADIVTVMPAVAIVILSLPALFPVTHVIAVIVNIGRRRRRRRPVLGLKEDQWWRIMAILAAAWFLIAVAAAWMIGGPLHGRALASGYIDCNSTFEPANGRRGPPPTYALSADLCLEAGFRRSRNRTGS